ncbi:hypothetical protein [Chryseobacterium salviniae]|uniref:Lipoprotein n=1 Tax=Chryseobacterium salviniae TaxID=3101750 RepID=A0ABU6HP29_9FLAO|nr:hypothetical protein [Chryseobacterium sp. T9W2-O]MEC3874779.1 hypothetical protein [Chryseobacterium sp. T9W2-O]
MKHISLNSNIFFILIIISLIVFYSCKKQKTNNDVVLCSFQNLVCDYPKNDSVYIKNVEFFLLFPNSTDDTIKISLKEIKSNYRSIYRKDTFKINFEATNLISIPPHDSLGVPCMSIIEKKFIKNDNVFKEGFTVLNIKTNEIINKSLDYSLDQVHDFQLYKKWGKKSDKINL